MHPNALDRPALTDFLESITDAALSGGEKYSPPGGVSGPSTANNFVCCTEQGF